MAQLSPVLALWQRARRLPAGKWLFSRMLCFKAPYFGSIAPRFERLEPGYCEVHISKRRKVQNHIGTVHAIAMCNMAELAAGTMTEVTIPATHRWIPKGMSVDYVAKAETSLRAAATWPAVELGNDGQAVVVPVQVIDTAGQTVLRAEISMWVSPRKAG